MTIFAVGATALAVQGAIAGVADAHGAGSPGRRYSLGHPGAVEAAALLPDHGRQRRPEAYPHQTAAAPEQTSTTVAAFHPRGSTSATTDLRPPAPPLPAQPVTPATVETTTTIPHTSAPASRLAPPTLSGLTLAQIQSDAAWITTAQLPDGAIATYPDQKVVSPYLANMAAEGLARASVITHNLTYAADAWRELAWYSKHENTQGYVTDYDVYNGVEVSTGNEDSTDAYAGTFLLAAATTWAADPDPSQLAALRPGLQGAVSAIESTQDSDGLTWAKPSWHVKYLMDQAETYAGLIALPPLASALDDVTLAARAASDAARMRAGVAALWNPALASYDWAVNGDGTLQTTDWANLYPDSMEQAWAAAYGLTSTSTASELTRHLAQAHPEWDQPTSPALINGTTGPAGYWPVAGFAFLAAGMPTEAAAGAASIQEAADAAGRAWPFTPADAGNLIVLATGGPIHG